MVPIFVTEDTPHEGLYSVNFQFPTFWMTLIAANLSFALHIVEFVTETRGNPDYRDIPLGNGVYRRYTPHKSVDLSSSFLGTHLTLGKDGDADDRYTISVIASPEFKMGFRIDGQVLDDFLDSIREVVEDYCERMDRPGKK